MKIKGFHHIAIICSNYPKSKHFYVDILGFSILKETFRSDRQSYKLDLSIGGRDVIELFSFPNPPKRNNSPETCGLRHIAFAVDNIQDIITHLTNLGINVEAPRIDENTGQHFTFLKDPDGLPIEIYEKPAP